MKKILSLVTMLLMVLSTNAQQQEAGTFSIAPKLGFGVGFINCDDIDDGDTTSGITFTLGADAQYQINDVFGISAGLDYRYFRTSKTKHSSNYYHVSTLSIPVLAHFNIGKHFGVFTGVQPEFILSAKKEIEEYKESYSLDLTEEYVKGFELTIPVGIQWTFNSPLVLGIRYNIGVTDILQSDLKSKNSATLGSVIATLAYRFDL